MVKSAASLLHGCCPKACLLTDAASLLSLKNMVLAEDLTGCVVLYRYTQAVCVVLSSKCYVSDQCISSYTILSEALSLL